ncbi:Lipoprotein [Caenorhabditis elegans]|uniref:Lipoprotein n=1 Tax=Caenorhabditis elegans TaxID=6239 RepID=C7IVS2_CAEEL|nr:Lipoprotein [Caenorhabditis elegans]CBB16306.1 Lipoprotein [Caenorhabditis elegans]|eukprot:NP_001256663.1 Uncharacterized protein CELE_Y36E3A.2 [Caenorhabditis elegans]
MNTRSKILSFCALIGGYYSCFTVFRPVSLQAEKLHNCGNSKLSE